jgi:hypothetical protein
VVAKNKIPRRDGSGSCLRAVDQKLQKMQKVVFTRVDISEKFQNIVLALRAGSGG